MFRAVGKRDDRKVSLKNSVPGRFPLTPAHAVATGNKFTPLPTDPDPVAHHSLRQYPSDCELEQCQDQIRRIACDAYFLLVLY